MQDEVQREPMRRLGYNPRQQRLLSLFPCSRLAFNGRRPADPDHWVYLSKGDAGHWQARILMHRCAAIPIPAPRTVTYVSSLRTLVAYGHLTHAGG